MARIVIVGAGLTGLATALLLARDGHSVTVLERDAATPEGDADELCESWERPGVSQFRLGHIMQPRWRRLMEQELPDVIDEAERLGGRSLSMIDLLPPAMTGGPRPGDEELRLFLARRPVLEGALAAAAARTPGLTIRRGTRVEALVSTTAADGVPHVDGVVVAGGETVPADLVVDAMGRNTPVDRMLDAIGARRPQEQQEDYGVTYYGRRYRADRPVPGAIVPLPGMTMVWAPEDAGFFSVVFVVASNDRDLRGLREVPAWERVAALLPNLPRLLAVSTPVTDVGVMSSGADRYRFFVVDGEPVATGLVAVGDSVVRSDPSLGRGSAMGMAQACVLRDVLREVGPDRPAALASRFAEVLDTVVGPLYRTTLDMDISRMAEIQADIAGTPYPPANEAWAMRRRIARAVRTEPDVFRVLLRANGEILDPDLSVLSPEVRARLDAQPADTPAYPPNSPTRAQMLAAVAGTGQPAGALA